MLVLKEVFIRLKISSPIQKMIDVYKRINEAMEEYLIQLKELDYEAFKSEIEKYNELIYNFNNINSEDEMNRCLTNITDKMGIKKPWKGDFKKFMLDKNNVLEFD